MFMVDDSYSPENHFWTKFDTNSTYSVMTLCNNECIEYGNHLVVWAVFEQDIWTVLYCSYIKVALTKAKGSTHISTVSQLAYLILILSSMSLVVLLVSWEQILCKTSSCSIKTMLIVWAFSLCPLAQPRLYTHIVFIIVVLKQIIIYM